MLFVTMAWRNVWRNRRRSLLTGSAIALSLAFNILMRGIGDGFHEQMVDNSVRANIGHIEVHRKGYHDDPGLNRALPDPRRVDRAIHDLPHLRGSSFAFWATGSPARRTIRQASPSSASIPGGSSGHDHSSGRRPGRYLDTNEVRPLLVGERLAATLRARLGDKVVLLVQAADGSMGAQLFRLTGIFRSGAPDLDRGVVYILLKDAQELFSLGDRVTEAVVLLDSSDAVPTASQALHAALRGSPDGTYEVLTWSEVEPYLEQFIVLDDAFFYIIVAILFIVIAVGILNTILMSVFERVREFGVMMALGTRPRQVVLLVVLEAAVLALVGIVVGGTLGSLSTLYFAETGINLSSFAQGAASLGITTTTVYSKLTLANVGLSNLAVFLLVVLVSLYPAVHAARLQPVEAIRHV